MALNPALPDFSRKYLTEPVPPEAHRLMTDIDAAFEQQILDLAQRKWVVHIHHHRQTNDLGRRVEIAERIFHPRRLRNGPCYLKPICSDSARVDIGKRKTNLRRPHPTVPEC